MRATSDLDGMKGMPEGYRIRLVDTPAGVDAAAWDALLAQQGEPTPFLRHAYLLALHDSGSAVAETGWAPRLLLLERAGEPAGELAAACALYLKGHSYGEYVFDWAWADAYRRHGLRYYPKWLGAVPFTPVPGTRLMAREAADRDALAQALTALVDASGLSSAHVLFLPEADRDALARRGWMLRQGVQFHWTQDPAAPVADFAGLLARLQRDKRKKIQQERRRVAEAGVHFTVHEGGQIDAALWRFFHRCYTLTYAAHHSTPYLTADFFARMAATMPEHWVMFVARRAAAHGPVPTMAPAAESAESVEAAGAAGAAGTETAEVAEAAGTVAGVAIAADSGSSAGTPIAASLIAIDRPRGAAWGRYWGAVEHLPCLHFEACYYQPLQWCIANGFVRFEGGAQGEHKMARGLLPVATASAHRLRDARFADAVNEFLAAEGEGVAAYVDELRERDPFKRAPPEPAASAVEGQAAPARTPGGDPG
jgi:uncharacterized protein